MFGYQRINLKKGSLVLLSMFAVCLNGNTGLEILTVGVESGQNSSSFSVPLVLLSTETGVPQNGAGEGATAAPASENEDDNSLGYTGTGTALHDA